MGDGRRAAHARHGACACQSERGGWEKGAEDELRAWCLCLCVVCPIWDDSVAVVYTLWGGVPASACPASARARTRIWVSAASSRVRNTSISALCGAARSASCVRRGAGALPHRVTPSAAAAVKYGPGGYASTCAMNPAIRTPGTGSTTAADGTTTLYTQRERERERASLCV
jgi:hypothetical protein